MLQVCLSILAFVTRHDHCVFSAPYYVVICGLFGCTNFFPHYLIKIRIFGKIKLLNIKCVS